MAHRVKATKENLSSRKLSVYYCENGKGGEFELFEESLSVQVGGRLYHQEKQKLELDGLLFVTGRRRNQ